MSQSGSGPFLARFAECGGSGRQKPRRLRISLVGCDEGASSCLAEPVAKGSFWLTDLLLHSIAQIDLKDPAHRLKMETAQLLGQGMLQMVKFGPFLNYRYTA